MPTDSYSWLLYSSSHQSHVKNSISYSQFLRLRRLSREDSDFSLKSKEMCDFLDKRHYLGSVVQADHHRTQQIDRQSALQTSQKENNNRIPLTLRSVFQTSDLPGTYKCARARYKTCPFICSVEKLSGPERSIEITDHFSCTSFNVIYCITCTLCKKLYTECKYGGSHGRCPGRVALKRGYSGFDVLFWQVLFQKSLASLSIWSLFPLPHSFLWSWMPPQESEIFQSSKNVLFF